MAKIEAIAERYFRDDAVEAELVAYILRKKPMLVMKLEPDWFSSAIHQNIIKIEKDIKAPIGKGTLMSELKKRKMISKGESKVYAEVLEELFSINVSQMNDKSVKIGTARLIELFEYQSILYGIRDIANGIKTMPIDVVKNRMKELGSGAKLPSEISSGDYVKGFNERREAIHEKQRMRASGKSVGIPTGIRIFDQMFGGLMNGEFGVVAGEPGVGKSAMLGAFATSAYESDYNVVIVTGEMPKMDFEFRIDSDMASVPATKFRFGNLTKTEEQRWKASIERQIEQRSNFLEVVSFPRNFTAGDIEGHILQIQDQYELEVDMICLDYLNIMNANGSHYDSKDWQGQAAAVWDVKAMCAELNGGVCLWTAGQLKDEGIGAEWLDLSMLKYARAISETAPIVIGLVRSQDDLAEDILEMQILKMRNAPPSSDSILLRPNLEYMRIHEEIVPKKKDILTMVQETKKREKPVKGKRRRSE
jgi:hypothetical protein